MTFDKFTIKAQEAIQSALDTAKRNGQQTIEPVHILAGVMDKGKDVTDYVLQKLGVNAQTVELSLQNEIKHLPKVSGGEPYFSPDSNKVLEKTLDISQKLGDDYVSIEPLLLALLQVGSTASRILKDAGCTEKEMLQAIQSLRQGQKVESQSGDENFQALSKYAANLVERARAGKLDPVIGRDEEIRRVLQILSRRTKNNPILIGEPGTGKTAIVEGLAERIVRGDVPENLKDKFPFALQSCFAFDDALDKVYIGAIHDIYILKDNYYTVYTPDPKADIHYYPAIQSLVLDKNGTLWFGGFTFGFLSSNGNTTLLNCGASKVNNIIIDDKDNKWLATNRGLIKYDGTSFTSYNTSGGQLSSNNVNGLAFDTNRNLWMGNWNVLVKYDGKQFSSYPLPSNYSNDWICDIAPDGNDVWVATRFHGLLRFYDGTFEQTELEKNILTQNLMHEVSTVDEKGNVCFASNDYLAQYTEKGEWKHLFPNAKDYYPAINAAAYDKRGRLWVAPNNSDTILAVIENADTTVFKRDNTPFQTGQLKQLEFDSKNHLWVGASNGLYKYDGVQWSQYNSSNSPMPGDMITSLAFDKSDRVWVGIADLGVCSFDGHNWVCHDTINSPIPYNYVDCIAVDSHNRVWMNSRYSRNGTPVMGKDYGGGLVCYDGTNWKFYNQYNSNIGGNCIVDIAIDKHDALWMAVSDIGLVRFDGENQWDAYTIYNSGLANPWPIQVQIDVKRDMIWFSYEASGGISSAKMNQGTGVEGIFVTPNGAKAIYTIEGRKVKAMTPGQIYIIRDENGKTTKVLAR